MLQGNSALAIFLTVATNVLGVLVIPLWLKAILKVGSEGVETLNIAYVDIFVKLLLSFFVPAVLGKVGALGCVYIALHCLPLLQH